MPMDLDVLLTEGEAIAEFTTTDSPVFNIGGVTYHMIVSTGTPLDRQDLSGCLEDTLHRLLNASASPSDIECILGAVPSDEIEDTGNGITEIDLGYAIPGQLMTIDLMEPLLPSLSDVIAGADEMSAAEPCRRQETMPELAEI